MKFYALLLVLILSECSPEITNSLSQVSDLPADGTSLGKIVLKKGLFSPQDSFLDDAAYLPLTVLAKEDFPDRTELFFQSPEQEQDFRFFTANGLVTTIHFYKAAEDSDRDGFPDKAELFFENDRKAFLDWFVRIAESQFKKTNYAWNQKERDCSGLVRYAYREALKQHNREWFEKSGIGMDKNLPDVKKFNYPGIPVIGKNIFRIKPGSGASGGFHTFADAETLMKYNTSFISKNVKEARAGDLLFFHNKNASNAPYHTVIVTKNDLQATILLYHTGSEQGIKRVEAGYLDSSRNFAPREWNDYFLGVFRFLIVQ